MSSATAGPGPVSRDDATAAFFDAAARGELLLTRCATRGHWNKPQAAHCDRCGSPVAHAPASGRATLVSWAVVHPRPGDGPEPRPVSVPAIVELAEGPWWWTRLVDVDISSLTAGTPLVVRFERPEGSEAVPVFTLA